MATFVWILVTLITDWTAVFYRKHIIYKKRMRDDLVRNEGITEKTLNSSTSALNMSQKSFPHFVSADEGLVAKPTDTQALI